MTSFPDPHPPHSHAETGSSRRSGTSDDVRVVPRIPEGQPFSVGTNVAKVVGAYLAIGAFTVVASCYLGRFSVDSEDEVSRVATWGCLTATGAAVFGLLLWMNFFGGPRMAANPDGLWLRTRPTRGQAIWLPWDAIERIYPDRVMGQQVLCVRTRDSRIGAGLGAYTALDTAVQRALLDTRLAVPMKYADHSQWEILQALAVHANGRCEVVPD